MSIVVNVAFFNWPIQNLAPYQSVRIIVIDAIRVLLFAFSGFSGKYSNYLFSNVTFVD